MFSSLEALDAEATLHSVPVARQGAFQPKAKPRVRKGAPLPPKKASALSPSEALPKAARDSLSTPDNAINQTAGKPSVVTQVGGHVEAQIEPSKDANVTGAVFGDYSSPTHDAEVAIGGVKATMETRETIALLEESVQWQGVDDTPQSGAQGVVVLNTQVASSAKDEQQPLCQPTQTSKDMEPASLDQLTYDREVYLSTLRSTTQDAAQKMVNCEELIGSNISQYKALGKERTHMSNQDDDENLENMVAQESSQQTVGVDPLLETSGEKLAQVRDKPEMQGGRAKKGKEPFSADANQPKKSNVATSAVAGASEFAAGIAEASCVEERIEERVIAGVPRKKEKKACSAAKEPKKVGLRLLKSEAKSKAAMLAATPTAGGPRKEVGDEMHGAHEDIGGVVVANTQEKRKRKKNVCMEARERQESGQDVLLNTQEERKRKNSSRMEASEQRESGQDVLLNTSMPSSQMKQGASPALSSGDASKRKRTMPAKYADTTASLVLDALTEEVVPTGGNTSEHVKKKKRGQLKEFDKPKKSKSADLCLASGAFGSALSAELPDSNGAVEPVEPEKKKFKKFVERRKRVQRGTSINPADPDLDPKKMTMMDIIRLAEAKDRMLRKGNAKESKDGKEAKSSNVPEHDSPESTCMAPQVQIIDGHLVINQESLTVQAHPKDDVRTYKRVEETHSKLNYHSYMKKTPKQQWRKDETELFYQALREFGTNFAMIQHLFPGRMRKQIFLKFKKEEKRCPLRVAEALRLRPCEYSQHIEILSLMNLLPTETSDSPQDISQNETTFSREEEDEVACSSIADIDRLMAAKGGSGSNGGAFKAEEWPTQSKCGQEREVELQADEEGDNEELKSEETAKPEEIVKPEEMVKKLPSPPRKRSLFSYQMSTTKS